MTLTIVAYIQRNFKDTFQLVLHDGQWRIQEIKDGGGGQFLKKILHTAAGTYML